MKSALHFGCVLSFIAIIDAQVPLGSASLYALIGGNNITNTRSSNIFGNIGISPGSSVVGFPTGTVFGETHIDDSAAVTAKSDASNAYDVAALLPSTSISPILSGVTLTPGVYNTGRFAFLAGTLKLDGQSNPASVWVFQMDSTLITATNATVNVINGANPCNVFWQVGSSVTLQTGTTFVGNILARTSITLVTGATNLGGLYALDAAVTLDTNKVSSPFLCSFSGRSSPNMIANNNSSTDTGTGTGTLTDTSSATASNSTSGTAISTSSSSTSTTATNATTASTSTSTSASSSSSSSSSSSASASSSSSASSSASSR